MFVQYVQCRTSWPEFWRYIIVLICQFFVVDMKFFQSHEDTTKRYKIQLISS